MSAFDRHEFPEHAAKIRKCFIAIAILLFVLLVGWIMVAADVVRLFEQVGLSKRVARKAGAVTWLGVVLIVGLFLRRIGATVLRRRGMMCEHCHSEIWPHQTKAYLWSCECPMRLNSSWRVTSF